MANVTASQLIAIQNGVVHAFLEGHKRRRTVTRIEIEESGQPEVAFNITVTEKNDRHTDVYTITVPDNPIP